MKFSFAVNFSLNIKGRGPNIKLIDIKNMPHFSICHATLQFLTTSSGKSSSVKRSRTGSFKFSSDFEHHRDWIEN
ncbi:hypothetical protein VitviT2T_009505 [Vitis vinifera]|uniref:Uncharacterized protein n=1 Tax=Vitis vinifera TaxID=29760 RepID=A0ABY9C7I2_VITVI|nr:hypothetical protein VitviT2T_009505 [Vitis vinifera]